MLANCTLKDTGPVPAYGTTRYNGAINLKENINQYYINAPRKIFFGFSSPCTKIDKRSKDLENKRTREKEDNVCKNVTKSSVLSVCGPMSRESSHCTCQDEKSCICLENGQKESKTSSENSLCYTDWKEIYKLTDTSDTKLTNSCERLLNCIQNGGDTNTYLNLFEPHPRKERQIKGKDLPPSGYNVTLILPQCVCLQNYQKDKQIPNIASDETIRDEICETISELCMPNIPELSWDIMQSGIVEKIPEKYTRNIFESENDDSVCTNIQCTKIRNSQITYCSHKAFLENTRQNDSALYDFQCCLGNFKTQTTKLYIQQIKNHMIINII